MTDEEQGANVSAPTSGDAHAEAARYLISNRVYNGLPCGPSDRDVARATVHALLRIGDRLPTRGQAVTSDTGPAIHLWDVCPHYEVDHGCRTLPGDDVLIRAAEHASKVLPEPIANACIKRMEDLMAWHHRDPNLLDYEGRPSYRAEAEGIAGAILAMDETRS